MRVPADERSTGPPWTCSPRTFAIVPPGRIATSSPVATVPPITVPVTTVPNPFIEKERSTGRRNRSEESFPGIPAAIRSRTATSSGSPCPVAAETRTIGAPSRNVPRTSARISSSWRSIQSLSALSHLLRTTIP